MSKQGFRQIFRFDEPNLKELNDMLRWLYSKVTGRVEMRDLSTETKATIDSKADGAVVDEIKDTADQANRNANAATEAVVTLNTELIQTKEAIILKADKETVNQLSGEVTRQAAELKVTAEQVSSTVERVETLDGTVKSQGTQIVQTAEKIESKAEKSAVDELGRTVSQQGTYITQTAEKIESKAEKSQVDALGNVVAGHESVLQQTPEMIRAAVQSVQIGGTNMVRLGEGTLGMIHGFADRGWGKSVYCRSGVGLVLWAPNSEYNGVHFYTDIPVTAGEYMLSFWTWSYGTDAQPVLRCNLFNGDAGIDHYFHDVVVLPNTPVRHEIPVTVTYEGSVNLRLITWTKWTTGEMYISDVKFEKGTKATDWSPAPEDTDGAITELSAALTVQAGAINANATKIETVDGAAASAQNAANAAQGAAQNAQNAANAAQGAANENAQNLNMVVQRVTTAEQTISAMDGKIASKVEQSEFNALGNLVNQNSSRIEQTKDEVLVEVSKKQNIGDPAAGVDTGDAGKVRMRVTADAFDIDVPGEDGDFTLNETGGRLPVLISNTVMANNLAYRYDGAVNVLVNPGATSAQLAAGNYFRSLVDACAAISGKYLDKGVTIVVQGATYGDAELRGVTGYGSVTIDGGGNILYGSISLNDNHAEVWVNNLHVIRSGTAREYAGRMYGTGWARWYQCTLDGNGGAESVLLDRGALAKIRDCGLYNAEYLLHVGHNADASCINLRGGGGTNFLLGDGGRLTWGGTRPDGALRIDNPCLREPYDLSGLTVDYGTAQPSVPAIQTASWNYLYSDSYCTGWSWINDDDVRQGYNGNRIYGVIWFDAAAMQTALAGKTINQASLRLYMHDGVGRGVGVSVQLYGTDKEYAGRSGRPEITAAYGTIGTTEPGAVNEITIPAQAIANLISGTTKALVLLSDDTELYKDRDYSRNYARFAGSTSADGNTCPRLTVVYQ